MNLPRQLHTDISPDNPTFTLKVNGRIIDSAIRVNSLIVERSANRIPTAEVILYDGDPSQENFEVSSMQEFVPNAEIEIELGYHTDNKPVFKGIITHHSIKVFKDEASLLHLTCKDKAVRMTVGRKNFYWYDKNDKDVIQDLIRKAGLQADVEATQVSHPEMVQFHCTDWDFILTRAEANSKLVFAEDGKLIVKKPDFSQNPAISLLHGASILDFEAEIDSRCQYGKVEASAWDAAKHEMKEVQAKDPGVKSPGNLNPKELSKTIGLDQYEIRHAGQINDMELQEWADAEWLKSQLAKVRGRVRFQGHSGVKPGDMIELGGLGDRFNGKAFVSGVRHEFDNSNWETDVSFGMDPNWHHEKFEDISSNPAQGLLPTISGLTIGIVTSLEDPEKEDRVRVRIPMIDAKGKGVWARIACLDAGKERGSFFRPEINDEVVLGFLNADPRNCVILGQLNSSKHPAPVKAKDTNHVKGFYTRSKMKLEFDDEKKSLTLITPKNQCLVIHDDEESIHIEDKHKNKILMNKDGISISTKKKLELSAGGDIILKSDKNISLDAKAKLNAKGQKGSNLSSGKNTVIKGSKVLIN